MKHSPTPWRLERSVTGNYTIVADKCWLDDRFGPGHSRAVAETRMHFGSEDPEVDGNAHFIVHAVNCHDELVALVEELTANWQAPPIDSQWSDLYIRAHHALTKAKATHQPAHKEDEPLGGLPVAARFPRWKERP